MNVADQISTIAKELPNKRSVVATSGKDGFGQYRYVHYTFKQLEAKINSFSNALVDSGVKKGDKALLFVKPCLDFSALAFALFKVGAIPVFIDPGMGRKPFLEAIKNSKPKIIIGLPKVFVLKSLFPRVFKSVKIQFVYAKASFFGVPSIIQKAKIKSPLFISSNVEPGDTAAILFTSGGTGKPKGVVYGHDIFIAQTKALQAEFSLTSDDIDVPGFPLFALFTLSMGMTSVIPDMDPSKPAKADPKALLQIIEDQSATFAAGSPAIWKKLGEYTSQNEITIPTLKYLVMFGAPIAPFMHRNFSNTLISGDTYTPYGATESLPVANAKGSLILGRYENDILAGRGMYVGKAVPGVVVKIIEALDGPLENYNDAKFLGPNEIGEILVHSPTTTKSYYELPKASEEAKVWDENGRVWHRMGDMGFLDEDSSLWFCGRKAHVVKTVEKTFYSVQVEAVFNAHPQIEKCALIEKEGGAALAIQRVDGKESLSPTLKNEFIKDLKELRDCKEHTQGVDRFFLLKEFPVDIRHNIKIDRKKVASLVNGKSEIK